MCHGRLSDVINPENLVMPLKYFKSINIFMANQKMSPTFIIHFVIMSLCHSSILMKFKTMR